MGRGDFEGDEAPPEMTAAELPVPAEVERAADGGEVGSALSHYLAELRRYPPISREEEHALALRWQDGDREAGRRLVLANLRLVVKIAGEYRRAWTNTLDLIQEGNLGLLQAVQRFDPYRGTKLTSYAAYWIRAYILKYLVDNIRMVKLGQSRAQRKLFFRLNKERRALENAGYRATPKLIGERLGVSEREVEEFGQRLDSGDLSLDAPMRGEDDEGASYGDMFAAPEPSAESALAGEELRRSFLAKVQEFQAGLGQREQRIMDARVLAEEPLTLQQLGEEMGVTRERVRQLEAGLVKRLREYLKENIVDFEYYAPGGD
ncbi:MAG: sigma-70 family RNA polymerase sigma factor [Deltaproteobacteria bacterium]|nr:sigma-70 family RNA polymerase sigma factor [Deltaproteobacteria bacterium]